MLILHRVVGELGVYPRELEVWDTLDRVHRRAQSPIHSHVTENHPTTHVFGLKGKKNNTS